MMTAIAFFPPNNKVLLDDNINPRSVDGSTVRYEMIRLCIGSVWDTMRR